VYNNFDVFSFLIEIGVTHLYHANTATTAASFLKEGGLLSRGAVESKSLLQTGQKSDDIDKLYGVWNDIFLDDLDIHQRSKKHNFYGPVLFRFKTEILTSPWTPDVAITKKNPVDWKEADSYSPLNF
jgi:hypothetical protein